MNQFLLIECILVNQKIYKNITSSYFLVFFSQLKMCCVLSEAQFMYCPQAIQITGLNLHTHILTNSQRTPVAGHLQVTVLWITADYQFVLHPPICCRMPSNASDHFSHNKNTVSGSECLIIKILCTFDCRIIMTVMVLKSLL